MQTKSGPSPHTQKIFKDCGLKDEAIHYTLLDMKTGSTVANYNGSTPFTPASLSKVLVAAYALEHLGRDYRFKTELYYDGVIKKNILKGDIYLKGYSDPSLTMARLMNLILHLKDMGVTEIDGQFFYDDSVLPQLERIADFGLGDQTYNPGLSALSLEYNRFWSHQKRGKEKVSLPRPPLPHIKLELSSTNFLPGQMFTFQSDDPEERWLFSSKKRYKLREEIPIRRPSRFTAESFRYFSQFLGIKTPSPAPGKTPSKASLIYQEQSVQLDELVSLMLEYSNNLFAEQILMTSTQTKTPRKAARKLLEWIQTEHPKHRPVLVNGSGLTTDNKITTQFLSDFLLKQFNKKGQKRHFLSLFSLSGQTGWLRRRLQDLAHKVWAKTGSLDYIDNIAGLMFTGSGRSLVFTLGISDTKKREFLNHSYNAKAASLRKKARRWKKKSSACADKLMAHWFNSY